MHIIQHIKWVLLLLLSLNVWVGCLNMDLREEVVSEEMAGEFTIALDAPCQSSSFGCPEVELVLINGGEFIMGDQRDNDPQPSELPTHVVNLSSFYMMKTEVTVKQYRLCVNADVCSQPEKGEHYNWSENAGRKENHPVNGISWYQLMEFAAWVGARLPTEAEWEYAARGKGNPIMYPWGNEVPTCELADWDNTGDDIGCNGSGTSPVCSTQMGNTDQDLCDLSGNVIEWVQDEWHMDYIDAPEDGSSWCDGLCPINADDMYYRSVDLTDRVLRGGGWVTDASYLRSTFRNISDPSNRNFDRGGRLAWSIP